MKKTYVAAPRPDAVTVLKSLKGARQVSVKRIFRVVALSLDPSQLCDDVDLNVGCERGRRSNLIVRRGVECHRLIDDVDDLETCVGLAQYFEREIRTLSLIA